jgi:N-methylhydantoinase A
VDAIVHRLMERGRAMLLSEGVSEKDMLFESRCDMRYLGQAYVPVILPLHVADDGRTDLLRTERLFHERHRELYKHGGETEPTELISVRVAAIGQQGSVVLNSTKQTMPAAVAPTPLTRGDVYFEDIDRFVSCPIFEKARLAAGSSVDGPAVIAQPDSLVLVYEGQRASVDQFTNIVLTERNDGSGT